MRKHAILLVALVVALGLAAACSKGRSDQEITTDIKAKMYSDPQVKGSSIDVTAKGGEVTLSGEVPSDAARYQAFKLATETPGVTKVYDHMNVKVAEATPAPAPAPEPAPAPARKLSRRTTAAPLREEAPPPPAPTQPAAAAEPAPPPPPQPKVVEVPEIGRAHV